jgi:HSP20 family molecular chaperone IbpA
MPTGPTAYEAPLPLAALAANGGWSPQVDVRELPDEYIVLADLPDVEPGAVEVTADQDT